MSMGMGIVAGRFGPAQQRRRNVAYDAQTRGADPGVQARLADYRGRPWFKVSTRD